MSVDITQEEMNILNLNGISEEDVQANIEMMRASGLDDKSIRADFNLTLGELRPITKQSANDQGNIQQWKQQGAITPYEAGQRDAMFEGRVEYNNIIPDKSKNDKKSAAERRIEEIEKRKQERNKRVNEGTASLWDRIFAAIDRQGEAAANAQMNTPTYAIDATAKMAGIDSKGHVHTYKDNVDKSKPIGFRESLAENGVINGAWIPFIGGYLAKADEKSILDVKNKILENKPITQQELDNLNRFIEKKKEEQVRGYSIGGRIAQSFLPSLIRFGTEMMAGSFVTKSIAAKLSLSGFDAAATEATTNALTKLNASEKVAEVGGKLAGGLTDMATTGAINTVLPTTWNDTFENYVERKMQNEFSVTPEGKILFKGLQESPAKTFAKSLASTFIMFSSEASGRVLQIPIEGVASAASKYIGSPISKYVLNNPKFTSFMQKAIPNFSKVYEKMNNLPIKGKNIDWLKDKVKFDGFFEEMGEEIVEDVLSLSLGLSDEERTPENYMKAIFKSPDEWAVLAGAIALQGGTLSIASHILGSQMERNGATDDEIIEAMDNLPEEEKMNMIFEKIANGDINIDKSEAQEIFEQQEESQRQVENDFTEKAKQAGVKEEVATSAAKLMGAFKRLYGKDNNLFQKWYNKLQFTNKSVNEVQQAILDSIPEESKVEYTPEEVRAKFDKAIADYSAGKISEEEMDEAALEFEEYQQRHPEVVTTTRKIRTPEEIASAKTYTEEINAAISEGNLPTNKEAEKYAEAGHEKLTDIVKRAKKLFSNYKRSNTARNKRTDKMTSATGNETTQNAINNYTNNEQAKADEKFEIEKQKLQQEITDYLSEIEALDIADDEVMFQSADTAGAESGEESDAAKEYAEKGTDSKYFKKWFGDSKAVDEDNDPKILFRGDVVTFDTFDKGKASAECDMGAGFYFSDNESDVDSNYYDGGPDFDNKVSRLAEQIQDEKEEEGEDIDYEEAKELAEKQLRGTPQKLEVYLSIQNPVYVGTNETYLLSDIDEYFDINEEDYEDEDEYYQAQEEAIDEALGNIGYNIDSELGDLLSYDDIERAKGILFEYVYNGGVTLQTLKDRLNEEYFEDYEGNLVANEVARRIVKALGYDSIIDDTVSEKFRNMGMEYGTTHYIVFEPEQIKSVENQGTFDSNNANIFYQKAEDEKDLVMTHSAKIEYLDDILDSQSLIAPSFAITNKNQGTLNDFGFGDLIFVRKPDAIQFGKDNIYDRDIYSARMPHPSYKTKNGTVSYYDYDDMKRMWERDPERFKKMYYGMTFDEYFKGAEKVLFKGFTPSGNRKYVPYNADNIIKEMKRAGLQNGEKWGNTLSSFLASLSKKQKNLKQLKKTAKVELGRVENEVIQELKDEYNSHEDNLREYAKDEYKSYMYFSDVYPDIMKAIYNDNQSVLNEYLDLEKLNEKDPNYLQEIKEFLAAAVATKRTYFEAKPMREVMLDEFKAVMIPSDNELTEEQQRKLNRLGLKVIPYERGKINEALEKANVQDNLQVFFQSNGYVSKAGRIVQNITALFNSNQTYTVADLLNIVPEFQNISYYFNNIKNTKVVFVDNMKTSSNGLHSSKQNTIYINKNKKKNQTYTGAIATVLHELEHVHQHKYLQELKNKANSKNATKIDKDLYKHISNNIKISQKASRDYQNYKSKYKQEYLKALQIKKVGMLDKPQYKKYKQVYINRYKLYNNYKYSVGEVDAEYTVVQLLDNLGLGAQYDNELSSIGLHIYSRSRVYGRANDRIRLNGRRSSRRVKGNFGIRRIRDGIETFYQEAEDDFDRSDYASIKDNLDTKKARDIEEYYGYFMTTNEKNIIGIINTDNPSTIVHEMGHLFLQGLNEFAEVDADAKKRLDEVNKWLGHNEGEPYSVAQQERFARSFEAYLYKGKAPTSKLRQVFEDFKQWLKEVYASIVDIPEVDLSEETQELFDRIFYGEGYTEEKREAQKLYNKINEIRTELPQWAKDEKTTKNKDKETEAYRILSITTGEKESYLRRIYGGRQQLNPSNKMYKIRENIRNIVEEKVAAGDSLSSGDNSVGGYAYAWYAEANNIEETGDGGMELLERVLSDIEEKNFNLEITEGDFLDDADAQYSYLLNEYKKTSKDDVADEKQRSIVLAAFYDWIEKNIPEEFQETYTNKFLADTAFTDRRENMDKFARAKEDILNLARETGGFSKNDTESFKNGVIQILNSLKFLNAEDKARLLVNILNTPNRYFLEAGIDGILDIAKTMDDRTLRRNLTKQIHEELMGTKNVKQGARTVGKYDYQTNKLFEKLRELDKLTVDQANDMRLSLEGLSTAEDEGLSFEDKLINEYITFKANGTVWGDTQNIKALYDDIVKVKLAAKDAKSERELLDKLNTSKDVEELVQILNNKKVAKDATKTYINWFGNAESTLNAIFNKHIANKYGSAILQAETDSMVWIYEKKKKFEEGVARIYNLPQWNWDRKILDNLAEKHTFTEHIREYDAAGDVIRDRAIDKEMNKMEIILAWMWDKNEILHKRLVNQFGEEGLNDMFSYLADEDMKLGSLMLHTVNDFYPEVNEMFIKKYGLDMPQVQCYFPSTPERAASEIELLNEYTQQSMNTGFTKQRSKSETLTMNFHNPIQTLYSHIDGVGKFIKMTDILDKSNKVLKDRAIKRLITNKYGADAYKTMAQVLANVSYKAGAKTYSGMNEVFNNIIQNWVQSNVILRPIVGLKQLLSANNYAVDMPYMTWQVGFLKALSQPKKTIEYMMNIPYLKARFGGNYSNEFLQQSIENSKFAATKKLKDYLSLNIKLGDIGAIIFGGKPYIDYLRSQGMSEEEAINKFILSTQRSQQSSAVSSLSNLQVSAKNHPFAQILTAYKNSPQQYVRMCGDAIVSVANGDMTKKQCAKVLFQYLYIQPLFYTMAGSGSLLTLFLSGDDDDLLKDLASSIFNLNSSAIPILGDAYQFALNRLAYKNKYLPQTTPMLGDIENEIVKISKEDVSLKDYLSFIGTLLQFASGVDVNAVGSMTSSVGDFAQGNIAEGALKAIGYSKKRAKHITGNED